MISKIPTNIRAESRLDEIYDFVVRRSDIARFDRARAARNGGVA